MLHHFRSPTQDILTESGSPGKVACDITFLFNRLLMTKN